MGQITSTTNRSTTNSSCADELMRRSARFSSISHGMELDKEIQALKADMRKAQVLCDRLVEGSDAWMVVRKDLTAMRKDLTAMRKELRALHEKENILSQRQGAATFTDTDEFRRVKYMLQQLQRAHLFTSRTQQAVGQNVLEASIADPLLDQLLAPLPFDKLPPTMKGIIESAFSKLATAANEKAVQAGYLGLFKDLREEVTAMKLPGVPCFEVHDTSLAGYLKSPVAKADFTFAANGKVSWPSVVWIAEAKASLDRKDEYENALGQVSDRAQLLFKMQPQRQHVIAAVLGATSLEVLYIPQCYRIRRSTQLTLRQSTHEPSPAARMLLRLFMSPKTCFDYVEPVVPAPFSIFDRTGQELQLRNIECLGPYHCNGSYSNAYKAECDGGEPVVIKRGAEDAIKHEEQVLELLAARGIKCTPRLLATGVVPGIGRVLIIKPVGRHFGVDDTPALIAQVALDIALAIVELHGASVLHCDVSANNILVTPDGHGLLVDFGSAQMGSSGNSHVTGTVLFSAISVLRGRDNSVSSDLESLFYSLMYIALDGDMPGSRQPSAAVVQASRLMAMEDPESFEERVIQRSPLPLQPLLQRLHDLFFIEGSTRAEYVMNVDPQQFVTICEEELAKLKAGNRGSSGAGSSTAGGARPASGANSTALPVHDYGQR